MEILNEAGRALEIQSNLLQIPIIYVEHCILLFRLRIQSY